MQLGPSPATTSTVFLPLLIPIVTNPPCHHCPTFTDWIKIPLPAIPYLTPGISNPAFLETSRAICLQNLSVNISTKRALQ